jgi:hypothetical protein
MANLDGIEDFISEDYTDVLDGKRYSGRHRGREGAYNW